MTACSLDLTTRATLGVLALASGVYTYLGVRDLLDGDATIVFFAAVIYSVAVSVGIYAFWTFMIAFMPHVRDHAVRGLLFGCMLLGSLMIIAMSAWLNASALAGSAAVEQHLAITLQGYTRDLDRAHNNALVAQGLSPDIQMALHALQQARRIRARRLAHRHVWLRHGGPAPDPDVVAARWPRPAGDRFEHAREVLVRARRQASCDHAGAGVRPRADQTAAATPSPARPWR